MDLDDKIDAVFQICYHAVMNYPRTGATDWKWWHPRWNREARNGILGCGCPRAPLLRPLMKEWPSDSDPYHRDLWFSEHLFSFPACRLSLFYTHATDMESRSFTPVAAARKQSKSGKTSGCLDAKINRRCYLIRNDILNFPEPDSISSFVHLDRHDRARGAGCWALISPSPFYIIYIY